MIMDSLQIRRRATYEDNAGKYTAEIHYISGTSKHTLTLDEVISERVLAFIGPVICEAAALVAEEAKKNITRAIDALHNQRAIEAGDLLNAGVSQTAPPEVVEAPPCPSPDSPAMEAELRTTLEEGGGF